MPDDDWMDRLNAGIREALPPGWSLADRDTLRAAMALWIREGASALTEEQWVVVNRAADFIDVLAVAGIGPNHPARRAP